MKKYLSILINRLFTLIFLIMVFSVKVYAVTAVVSGNWSNPATWGGTLPASGNPIIIPTGITVTVDINTPVVGDVTINGPTGSLVTQNIASSNLAYSGHLTVSGSLINNGGIEQTSGTLKNFILNANATYLHNPRNNTSLDETIFSASNENFAASSNLIIQKWNNMALPLGAATRVQSSNFGNVTLSVNDLTPWEQNGEFMNSVPDKRIYGSLTVSAGIVIMDNGNGLTNDQYYNDVNINGTGNIIFQSGQDRPLFLITNNFTDISTSLEYTVLSDSCFGAIVWLINGSATFGHNFKGIRGSEKEAGGSLMMTVNGNITISGGDVSFINKARAALTLNVAGNTSIQGSPSSVKFIDGNDGNLVFSTNNFNISGGAANVLLGGTIGIPKYTGQPSINISNDLIVSGISNTTLLSSDSTSKKLRLVIGHDLTLSADAQLTCAFSNGAFTLNVANQFNQTNGQFIGQANPLCALEDSLIIGGNFIFNSATASSFFRGNYGNGQTAFRCNGNFTMTNSGTAMGQGFSVIYNGTGDLGFYVGGAFLQNNGRVCGIYCDLPIQSGNMTFQSIGTFTMNGGSFRGIANRELSNDGSMSFTTPGISFSGGNFKGHYSAAQNGVSGNFTINGNCNINFSSVTDTFMFCGWTTIGASVNSMILNLNVNGDFGIGGAQFGKFISSVSDNVENINISGNVNITNGRNSFNSYPNGTLTNAHKVLLTITGNLSVSGGVTYLSANNDTLEAVVNGNFSLTGGELAVQGGNTYGRLRIKGGYTQSAGSFFFHRNATTSSYQSILVDINYDDDANGNFSHSAGVINFDDNAGTTQHTMFLRSPLVNYTTGSITAANPGTNVISGLIAYSHAGVINFNRLTNFHTIQQVEQHVNTGTTLNILNGNLQIASYVNTNTNWLIVQNGAILDLKANQIFSNALQTHSGLKIFGRLRTTRTQGLYDNTNAAAINSTGNMNYFLLTGSTIEYYGDDTQVITGIGVGQAQFSLHKYYDLEINFNGTAGTEFVYPTNIPTTESVFVRNKLILTNGELNLDSDHNNASGGRSIIVENSATNAITRSAGFIRSEVVDGSGALRWIVGNTTGARIVPFGYTAAEYIPLTFDLSSGSVDTMTFATYHTPTNNLPLPPTVTRLTDLSGFDNSAFTVDRFWYINASNASTPVANISFVCTPTEIAGIVNPRAQRWIPLGWELPQGTQFTIANGTLMQNSGGVDDNWWTLAAQTNPLPIELLSFDGTCEDSRVKITWSTASELNNDHFNIERSSDGFAFVMIGSLPGNGNASSISEYVFQDDKPLNSKGYYRLTQVDFDGSTNYFEPIVVQSCEMQKELDVYLISSQNYQTEFNISAPTSGRYTCVLFTLDGRILSKKSVQLKEGNNLLSLDHTQLSSALYLLRVSDENIYMIGKKFLLGE